VKARLLAKEETAMTDSLKTHAKTIVGVALLGLGCFVLYEHLSHVAAQLTHLCSVPCAAPGGLADAILSGWKVYPADQKRFVHAFLRHILLSSWPLLLVWAGTALSRETFVDDITPLPKNSQTEPRTSHRKSEKKIYGSVDLAARRSTSK
jgi:hypothetical protein